MHLFQHFSRRRIGSSVHSQGTNHSLGPGRCEFSCSGSEGPGCHTRGTLVSLYTAANGAGTGVRKPKPVALRRASLWYHSCSREPHRIKPSLGFSESHISASSSSLPYSMFPVSFQAHLAEGLPRRNHLHKNVFLGLCFQEIQ